jgi:hypothetical protein
VLLTAWCQECRTCHLSARRRESGEPLGQQAVARAIAPARQVEEIIVASGIAVLFALLLSAGAANFASRDQGSGIDPNGRTSAAVSSDIGVRIDPDG